MVTKIICPRCDGAGCDWCDHTGVQVGMVCLECEGNGCRHCNFTGIELEQDVLNTDVVYNQKQKSNVKKYIFAIIFVILAYAVITNIDTIIYILQVAAVIIMVIVLLWIINFFGKINQKRY